MKLEVHSHSEAGCTGRSKWNLRYQHRPVVSQASEVWLGCSTPADLVHVHSPFWCCASGSRLNFRCWNFGVSKTFVSQINGNTKAIYVLMISLDGFYINFLDLSLRLCGWDATSRCSMFGSGYQHPTWMPLLLTSLKFHLLEVVSPWQCRCPPLWKQAWPILPGLVIITVAHYPTIIWQLKCQQEGKRKRIDWLSGYTHCLQIPSSHDHHYAGLLYLWWSTFKWYKALLSHLVRESGIFKIVEAQYHIISYFKLA